MAAIDKKASEDRTIAKALQILQSRVREAEAMNSPAVVKNFLRIKFAGLEREVFSCIWLDSQNKVIAVDDVFAGTLTQTSVYSREIVKLALKHNAASVLLAHNHPSGCAEPSGADEYLTKTLKSALALVDVRVLDHFVVGDSVTSFAEKGLI